MSKGEVTREKMLKCFKNIRLNCAKNGNLDGCTKCANVSCYRTGNAIRRLIEDMEGKE